MDIEIAVRLLVADEYRNDGIIKDISEIYGGEPYNALKAYADICRRLIECDMTFSEYLFRLAVTGAPIRDYAVRKENGAQLYDAVLHDILVLSSVSRVPCEELAEHIGSQLPEFPEISRKIPELPHSRPPKHRSRGWELFPRFETGDTDITVNAVSEYIRKYGSHFYREHKAFVFDGEIRAVKSPDQIRLEDIKYYGEQKKQLTDNIDRFLSGRSCSDVLLYGERGTGKSSLVKAAVNEHEKLKIIMLPKNRISEIYKIFDSVKSLPYKFVIFLDDLVLEKTDESYTLLKQVLEGSVRVTPRNCIICATTNRRHIIGETAAERDADTLYSADIRDENVSLADRFPLMITFMSPDKKLYLDIVLAICKDKKIKLPEEEICALAERFAIRKGSRSGRTARQFTDTLL